MTRAQAAEKRLIDAALEIIRRVRALQSSDWTSQWFFNNGSDFMDAADHFVSLPLDTADRPASGWIRATAADEVCPRCGHLASQHRTAGSSESHDTCQGDVTQVDQNVLPAFANGWTHSWCPCEEKP